MHEPQKLCVRFCVRASMNFNWGEGSVCLHPPTRRCRDGFKHFFRGNACRENGEGVGKSWESPQIQKGGRKFWWKPFRMLCPLREVQKTHKDCLQPSYSSEASSVPGKAVS